MDDRFNRTNRSDRLNATPADVSSLSSRTWKGGGNPLFSVCLQSCPDARKAAGSPSVPVCKSRRGVSTLPGFFSVPAGYGLLAAGEVPETGNLLRAGTAQVCESSTEVSAALSQGCETSADPSIILSQTCETSADPSFMLSQPCESTGEASLPVSQPCDGYHPCFL
jgi:hypothetical protein